MSEDAHKASDPKPDRKDLLAQQFSEAETPQQAPEATAPAEVAVDAAQAEPAEVEEPVWKRPPASWKREFHEPWETANDKLREYIWQREQEMQAGVEPLKPKAQLADRFQKTIEPYMTTIQGLGIDPIEAVRGLMDADHQLRTLPPEQKRALIARMAASYGVNLGEVEGQPVADPLVYELRNEINSVRGEVLTWKEQQQQVQDQQLIAEINEFAKDADLFEDARPVMVELLQKGLASSLSDAYHKALRLDDDLYEKAQGRLQAEAEAKDRAAADKAAKAAKAAAVSVKSSTPGASAPPKAPNRRALLEDQFDGMRERF